MKLKGMSIRQLHQHYQSNDFSPEQLIDDILHRAEQLKHHHSWIYLLSKEEIRPYLDRLQKLKVNDLPLYGIPFAIKDNIDLANIPTTAACEAFSYVPEQSAFVVEKLIQAGAIPIGKTNLDQFATGLVGTRSPYGAVKNSLNPNWISGGSSSGSAVVVAQGLVSFSLGTDTAGSGRIPAAFNNIIGLKPSRGLLSNSGVVPACQSLDCIAVFSGNSADLSLISNIAADYDSNDPFSRKVDFLSTSIAKDFCFAVPKDEQLEFFGNEDFRDQFQQSVLHMESIGGKKQIIDFQPFIMAAKLLYEGPWVSERYLAAQSLIDQDPDSLLDVIRSIISPGKDFKAIDVYKSLYQLQAYKQQSDSILAQTDFILTPTAGTIYSIDEVNHDPIKLNSNLGYYTNYMNLLDYTAIAIPFSLQQNKTPFGVTLTANAFSDRQLIDFAQRWQQSLSLPLGATTWPVDNRRENNTHSDTINLVVCGAHLSNLALNYQLTERDAVLIQSGQSAPHYRLYELPGTGTVKKPGMIRVNESGNAIDIEVWRMPIINIGSFLSAIPHPLGLGKVELEDGSWETGFICEPYMLKNAKDITGYGGWKKYMASINNQAES